MMAHSQNQCYTYVLLVLILRLCQTVCSPHRARECMAKKQIEGLRCSPNKSQHQSEQIFEKQKKTYNQLCLKLHFCLGDGHIVSFVIPYRLFPSKLLVPLHEIFFEFVGVFLVLFGLQQMLILMFLRPRGSKFSVSFWENC